MKASVDKPSVWMIISSFHPLVGGAEKQAQTLSSFLKENGWRVQVLTGQRMQGDICLVSDEVIDGVKVKRIPMKGRLVFLLSGLQHIWRYGRRSIFHAHNVGLPGWLAVLAAKLFEGKSIIKLNTGASSYKETYGKGFSAWQFRFLLKMADRLVVVSREVQVWLQHAGIPENKIVFIPNSVDICKFTPPLLDEKHEQRAQLRLPNQKRIFLYMGRLSHPKGVDIMLRAWAILMDELESNALLILVGDGEERAKLENLIKDLHLSDSVRLEGCKDNVRDYYYAADAFVLPSRTEGFSNALAEAMACGLPIVASSVGGTPDLIDDGTEGVLCISPSPEALAHCIKDFWRRREAWPSMGKQARLKVVENLDSHKVMCRFEALYRDVWVASL